MAGTAETPKMKNETLFSQATLERSCTHNLCTPGWLGDRPRKADTVENGSEWKATFIPKNKKQRIHSRYFEPSLLSRSVQDICGADLTVHHAQDGGGFWEGTTVQGTETSVQKAFNLFKQLQSLLFGSKKHLLEKWGELEQHWEGPLTAPNKQGFRFTFSACLTPTKRIGSLIGHAGVRVRSIEKETGALIHVSRMTVEKGMTLVMILGPKQACKSASQIVSHITVQ